jgi:hypothetical protein
VAPSAGILFWINPRLPESGGEIVGSQRRTPLALNPHPEHILSVVSGLDIPMRPRWYTNLAILLYVTFQVLYPVRGLIEDKFDTWGGFTWNMYSQKYECTAIYKLVEADGTERGVNFQQYFIRREKVGRVFHRDALPVFHKFLCERLSEEGATGKLVAVCECTKNGVETQRLTADSTDICSAPNYGVSDE